MVLDHHGVLVERRLVLFERRLVYVHLPLHGVELALVHRVEVVLAVRDVGEFHCVSAFVQRDGGLAVVVVLHGVGGGGSSAGIDSVKSFLHGGVSSSADLDADRDFAVREGRRASERFADAFAEAVELSARHRVGAAGGYAAVREVRYLFTAHVDAVGAHRYVAYVRVVRVDGAEGRAFAHVDYVLAFHLGDFDILAFGYGDRAIVRVDDYLVPADRTARASGCSVIKRVQRLFYRIVVRPADVDHSSGEGLAVIGESPPSDDAGDLGTEAGKLADRRRVGIRRAFGYVHDAAGRAVAADGDGVCLGRNGISAERDAVGGVSIGLVAERGTVRPFSIGLVAERGTLQPRQGIASDRCAHVPGT